LKENVLSRLKVVDIILEVIDSRVPLTGRIPNLGEFKGKERILVFSKIDLSDPDVTRRWKRYYEDKGYRVALVNIKSGKGIDELRGIIKDVAEKMRKKLKDRRVMVLGIPNVGKSSLINSIIHRRKARVGNEPGITKGIQWIKIGENLYILDTPGILHRNLNPKSEDYKKLCLVGSIIPRALPIDEVVKYLFDFLRGNYPDVLKRKYGYGGDDFSEFVDHISRMKKHIKKGGEYDRIRTLRMILDDSTNGRIGKISYDLLKGNDQV